MTGSREPPPPPPGADAPATVRMSNNHSGLREAHAHLGWYARGLSMIDVGSCTSVAECLHTLAEGAAALPRAAWLLATGARIASWSEPRWPTARELDTISQGRPCALMSFDHHALAANSAALTASGILTHRPLNTLIERNANGNPTGLALEGAAQHIWSAAPQPTLDEWRTILPRALEALERLGFIEVHDMLAPPWLGPLLREMEDHGQLHMRVRLFAPFDSIEAEIQRSQAYTTPNIQLAGAKLFADGTLNSRTAWMLDPFADGIAGRERGTIVTDTAALTGALHTTAHFGTGLSVHAIGDGAVRACLDAAATFATRRTRPHHLRIEHCEVVHPADIPRFAELGVTASVQPCHLLADVEALRAGLPDRLGRIMPWRSMVTAGLIPAETLIFGSDVPVVRADPGDSIQAAVARRRPGEPPSAAIAPLEALTEEEAWACFRFPPSHAPKAHFP